MNLKEITTALDQLDLSKYELIKKEENENAEQGRESGATEGDNQSVQ
jgi:hypothetical protein